MSSHNSSMLCPVCSVSLTMSERQNVEIDYCPQCRGVWLDRGELDKIIERASNDTPPQPQQAQPQYQPQPPAAPYLQSYAHQQAYGKPYKKRKSFLEELFD